MIIQRTTILLSVLGALLAWALPAMAGSAEPVPAPPEAREEEVSVFSGEVSLGYDTSYIFRGGAF